MTDVHEWRQNGYLISTDTGRLNVDAIHDFLSSEAYWAINRTREVMERAIANSLVFGVYTEDAEGSSTQVGFARVVTDRATFAYLSDVFVLPSFRGQGLSKWLVECILQHPDLQTLRRFVLVTRDANTLYERFGFAVLAHPERYMERLGTDAFDKPL